MAQQSKKVFIHHSVFFAYLDRAHPKHAMADAYFRYFAETQSHVFTSNMQVMTCYQNLCRHMSVIIAKEFLRALMWGTIEVIRPIELEEKVALKHLTNTGDPNYSYQEALASVLAYRRSIPTIATFDPFKPSFGQTIFMLPF